MENFYKMGIANNRRLSCVLTYEDELTLMVGKSCLATLGSANSFGIQVSALTSKGRSVCSFGSTGDGCCTWLFHIKQKILCTTAFFPRFQHTAFYFPPFVETNGFETTDCLECLQILNILYMAGGSTLKLEIGHCALY